MKTTGLTRLQKKALLRRMQNGVPVSGHNATRQAHSRRPQITVLTQPIENTACTESHFRLAGRCHDGFVQERPAPRWRRRSNPPETLRQMDCTKS